MKPNRPSELAHSSSEQYVQSCESPSKARVSSRPMLRGAWWRAETNIFTHLWHLLGVLPVWRSHMKSLCSEGNQHPNEDRLC